MNEFLLTEFSGLVQFERSMIKQRQKEGIQIAKAKGKFKGRKVELIEGGKKTQKAAQVIDWYKEGKSQYETICKMLSIGTGTLYRLLEREGLR
ncbi:hypothetical protein [Bacillus sp. CCB-MMP212]|uniref:hypothetical protein n=1 Tax=Bacillus sp. CCB-MMP212 TaxID=2928002 RepID=UPI003211ECD9